MVGYFFEFVVFDLVELDVVVLDFVGGWSWLELDFDDLVMWVVNELNFGVL